MWLWWGVSVAGTGAVCQAWDTYRHWMVFPISVCGGGGVLALGGWLTAEVQKEDLHAHMPRAAAAVFAGRIKGWLL